MRIDALQAFVGIAESGSFQAAADRLHLSQPGISKRVAALEARLGYRLLDRVRTRYCFVPARYLGSWLEPPLRPFDQERARANSVLRSLGR